MRMHNMHSSAALTARHLSKQEIFEDCPATYDFALPQNWLNDFSEWCECHFRGVTYDLIRSTCVWVYPERYACGEPMTCCLEVLKAYEGWVKNG